MTKRFITLFAIVALPVSLSLAGTKQVSPKGWTKDEVAVYPTIEEEAGKILASEKIASLKTPNQRIRKTFDQLVKSYGKSRRLVIAKAISTRVPKDLHGYIARRALYYSPVRAKELLASLSMDGPNSSLKSALGVLPTGSVHTAEVAAAVGVKLDRPGRFFRLPQVDARRRVASTFENGRLVMATGMIQLPSASEPQPATATLQPIQDNGFTLDGMGYALVLEDETLVGDYMAVQLDDAANGNLTFRYKNVPAGSMVEGAGGDLEIMMTGVNE